jgi:aminoglycoside 2'-N-acetyltransferase I
VGQVVRSSDAPAELLAAVHRLLLDAFGEDLSDDDWDHALGGWHAVVEEDGAVLAHAAVVPRALEVAGVRRHAGYVEAVATAPGRQGAGLGSRAMALLAGVLHEHFELGALSTDRHRFYERLGPTRDLDLTAPLSCEARAGDDW